MQTASKQTKINNLETSMAKKTKWMKMSFLDSPSLLSVREAEQFKSIWMETSMSEGRRGYGKHMGGGGVEANFFELFISSI